MNNKEFKQMVKQHKVKQTFCIPTVDLSRNDFHLNRIYIDTETPSKLYSVQWEIDYIKKDVIKTVTPITEAQYELYMLRYKSIANDLIRNVNKHADIVARVMHCINECPMYQKKFWQLTLDTVTFIINDRRI